MKINAFFSEPLQLQDNRIKLAFLNNFAMSSQVSQFNFTETEILDAVKQYAAEDLTIEGVQQWILDCRKHERRSQFSASLTQSFKSQINNQKNLESQASCSSSNNFLLDF